MALFQLSAVLFWCVSLFPTAHPSNQLRSISDFLSSLINWPHVSLLYVVWSIFYWSQSAIISFTFFPPFTLSHHPLTLMGVSPLILDCQDITQLKLSLDIVFKTSVLLVFRSNANTKWVLHLSINRIIGNAWINWGYWMDCNPKLISSTLQVMPALLKPFK